MIVICVVPSLSGLPPCICRACCAPFSLAVLIESLGCGTLPWRKEMEKGEGHGVRLVCDAVDSDIVMTQGTVSFSFGKTLWGGGGGWVYLFVTRLG